MSPADRKLMEEARDALTWPETSHARDVRFKLTERLAQPEQEPVAWLEQGTFSSGGYSPPFKEWRVTRNPSTADLPRIPLYTHQSPDVELVRQLVGALGTCRVMARDDATGGYTREVTPKTIRTAIEAGQQWLKERGK